MGAPEPRSADFNLSNRWKHNRHRLAFAAFAAPNELPPLPCDVLKLLLARFTAVEEPRCLKASVMRCQARLAHPIQNSDVRCFRKDCASTLWPLTLLP